MLSNVSDKKIGYIALSYAFAYFLLHYQAHMFITGGELPPHSDSLSYQYQALNALKSIADSTFSLKELLLGSDINHVPPLYKIVLLAAYMVGGLSTGSEYIINYLVVFAGGYYLGKISYFIYRNSVLQHLTFLAYITLYGVAVFSISDTRNDTLAITLYIVSIYYLFKSDFFYNLKYSLVVSSFISLALLAKSAFLGYLTLPLLLLIFMIYKTENNRIRFRNVIIGTVFIFFAAGWFYIVKYNCIMDYYSYWSRELASTVYEQYNIRKFYDKAVFYPKSTLNHFGSLVLLFVPFSGYGVFRFFTKKQTIKSHFNKEIVFVIGLAILPYIVLCTNGSYSIVADLYMVPFLLIIMMSLFNRYKKKKFVYQLIFLFISILGAKNVVVHYSKNAIYSIDHKSFVHELNEIVSKYSSSEKSCCALFHDLNLEMKTILYVNMKDAYLRNNSKVGIADISYKTRVTPNLPASEIYKTVKDKSNIFLIPNRSKGPQWININKSWKDLYTLIHSDGDMLKIGEINTYRDKTKVEVYLKSDIGFSLTTDGWLLNEAKLQITANPGRYVINIINKSTMTDIDPLYVKDPSGSLLRCKKESTEGKVLYSCELDISETESVFSVYSGEPLVPSLISDSKDARQLLLYKPIISMKRCN